MRLIDARYLTSQMYSICEVCQTENIFIDAIIDEIDNAPDVDAVEVVHGEWSTIEDDYTGMVALQCSECNQEWWFEDEPPMKIYHYCPNCGAKMDGDGNVDV